MGGDHAPNNEVLGALLALHQLGTQVDITLVGRTGAITPLLPAATYPIRVVHAEDVVGMGDEPSSILKTRQQSSLYVGLALMRDGLADAFVSGGNTGAVMASATMMCGRIKGVSRPTIGSFFPTNSARPTLVVDVGANVESKPRYMVDYAIMGSVYYQLIMGVDRPTVGLLNVGEEEEKGTDATRETFAILKTKSDLNFVGNVEGRDILSGTVDVVVCDGFEGNIVLKFAESVLAFLKDRFRAFAERGPLQKLAMGTFRPILKAVLRDMDYQEYGGVPLLGINGVVIIGHGSSSPKAIANMIRLAVDVVRLDVNGHIEHALAVQQPPEVK